MSLKSRLDRLYLSYFSKPAQERRIYRAIARHQVSRIVELGLGTAERSLRMLKAAGGRVKQQVHYCGVDEFEAGGSQASGALTLKQAYQLLRATGAKVQLVPGDPFSALSRAANELMGTDLLVISADLPASSLDRAWFYIPRMVHRGSLIFTEQRDAETGDIVLARLPVEEVEYFAAKANHRSPGKANDRKAA